MNDPRNNDEVAFVTGKMFTWVLVSFLLLAIVLFGSSYSVPAPFDFLMRDISMIFLGAVIVTFLHQKILSPYFRKQSKDIINEALVPSLTSIQDNVVAAMMDVIPRIKEETVKPIEEIRSKVTDASSFMLKGIGVLYGAKESGIINIFPKRYTKVSDESILDVVQRDIQAENSSIKVMGISLGDYFLDRGVLHKPFMDLITSKEKEHTGLNVRALIVHPKCEALKERARWEAGQEYFHEPAFYDSTTFIETEGSARIARRLCDKFERVISVKLYTQSPTAFVLLTSRFLFFEPYHYAARGCNVPVFQVQAGSDLYKYYEMHFDRIWDVSQSISEYESLGPPPKIALTKQIQPTATAAADL